MSAALVKEILTVQAALASLLTGASQAAELETGPVSDRPRPQGLDSYLTFNIGEIVTSRTATQNNPESRHKTI